jgi:hypothetical protein
MMASLAGAMALVALVATPAIARHRNLPFAPVAYWDQQIGAHAPADGTSAAIITFLRTDNYRDYISLSGTTPTGTWGTPVYNATEGDPVYQVHNSCWTRQPPEFASIRIPAGAKSDPTSDASMVVFDAAKGLEYGLWHAAYDPAAKQWSACGGTVYYMASNGLAGTLKESDEPRNYGHRGVPPETYAITFHEIQVGSINHLLKIAVNTTKCAHVFPMAGDECGTYASSAPPEGTVIRIKSSVDLSKLGLTPAAMTVARALQAYGAVIGDQSGASVELKVENVVAEGRGWLWNDVLSATSLSRIPLSSYEVVQLGYEG